MQSVRRQRTHDLMVREILDTARAIMREEGVAALSMQELARRLDLRAPSLYNYFASKHDVYDAVFRLGFELYSAYLEEGLAGAVTWHEQLRRYIEGHISFALENPELFRLCFERPVPGFVPSAASLEVSFGALRRGYDTAARWKEQTSTPLTAQQMADLVIAVMQGLAAEHLANEPDLPVGQGRFGGLVSAAVALFEKAWSSPTELEGDPK